MFNRMANNHLGFSISVLNRPLRSVRSGLNEFAEDARGPVPVVVTHGLAVVAL